MRGIGLASATALNMNDMIGVGPFITIPLIVSAMGGPRRCWDGYWARSWRSAMDWSGPNWARRCRGRAGSYRYLKEIYGPRKLGRLISFLFIWQLSFSAPFRLPPERLGCRSMRPFSGRASKESGRPARGSQSSADWNSAAHLGCDAGNRGGHWRLLLTAFLLYRRITAISRLTKVLWLGVMGTIGWIIFTGITHFNAHQAFDLPPGAFTFSRDFFHGLGGAMLIASYDIGDTTTSVSLATRLKTQGKIFPAPCCYPFSPWRVFI